MTQTELGKSLGITQSAVALLVKRGMPISSIKEAHAWREDHLNAASVDGNARRTKITPPKPAQPATDETFTEARTRREIAAADTAELELQELQGLLVRAADIRAALAKRASAVREHLLQMPARLVPVLAADPQPAAMHEALRAEIVASLQHIADAQQ